MHVRYYRVSYNPDMRELYGDDFKQYLRFHGLWGQRNEESWRKGARLPVVPRGSTVVVHCVKGIYQYAVDKRTGILKHPSSDVVALVEFLTHGPIEWYTENMHGQPWKASGRKILLCCTGI